MVTELLSAVNCFPGNCQKPIKLEVIAIGAAVDVDSLTVIGFMGKVANFAIYSPLLSLNNFFFTIKDVFHLLITLANI